MHHPDFNINKVTMKYFVLFYIIFAFFWYRNVSSSSAFDSILNIGDRIFSNIFNEFLNPVNRDQVLLQGLGIADPVIKTFGRKIHWALQITTQFFIIVGFIRITKFSEYIKLKAEYFYFIVASMIFLLFSILPYFAKAFNMTRIYHIALILLSPLFIIGGKFIFESLMKKFYIKKLQNYSFNILILGVLIPYFLFNVGFVYEITGDIPNSMSLGMEKMKSNNLTRVGFYSSYIPEQDVYSAKWYNLNKNRNKRVYADRDSQLSVLYSYGMTQPFNVINPIRANKLYTKNKPEKYYIYLRKFNVCDGTFVVSTNFITNTSMISPLFNNTFKVYSNGCGDIYGK